MQVEDFFSHWRIREHPFCAEEARDDPVFLRLMESGPSHPDFEKVYGDPTRPSASVVFGEKGAGKTALRLLLQRRFAQDADDENRRVWVVRYDDLNAMLDRFASVKRRRGDDRVLDRLRLADHQDAIFSQAVTALVDGLLSKDKVLPAKVVKTSRKMSRSLRVDLATMAALYDQPSTGNVVARHAKLCRHLRVGRINTREVSKWLGIVGAIFALSVFVSQKFMTVEASTSSTLNILSALSATIAATLLGFWAWSGLKLWWMSRRVRREVHVVERDKSQLYQMLSKIRLKDLSTEPIPSPGDEDSRYQWMSRFLVILKKLGYQGMVVLVDRVDEPALINGDAHRMRSVVWPLMNNKFLQQDGLGVKMLLPIELRHLLMKEDSEFFQRARLDKQHMIDRLTWSGATLYDLCTRRLQSCLQEGVAPITLSDLFDDEVSRQELTDALDQMQQPRDAFKFLYQVIQEHCLSVSQDHANWKIARLTLQMVRKQQAQRVQELHRGLAPA